jgi:hypothetical protein
VAGVGGDPVVMAVSASASDYHEVAVNAVRRLISATRDRSKYPLVFAENVSYGFARNLLGIRTIGIGVSLAALLAGVGLVAASAETDALTMRGTMSGSVVAAAMLLFWVFFPSHDRVHAAHNDYRDRLLDALDAGALDG